MLGKPCFLNQRVQDFQHDQSLALAQDFSLDQIPHVSYLVFDELFQDFALLKPIATYVLPM